MVTATANTHFTSAYSDGSTLFQFFYGNYQYQFDSINVRRKTANKKIKSNRDMIQWYWLPWVAIKRKQDYKATAATSNQTNNVFVKHENR